jgi:hypothetical protein
VYGVERPRGGVALGRQRSPPSSLSERAQVQVLGTLWCAGDATTLGGQHAVTPGS